MERKVNGRYINDKHIVRILKLPYQDYTTLIYDTGEEIKVPTKKNV